jgi:hypothetical protein
MADFNPYADKILHDVKMLKGGGKYAYIKILVLWMLLETWIDHYYSLPQSGRTRMAINRLRAEIDNPLFVECRGMMGKFDGLLQVSRNLDLKIPPAKTRSKKGAGRKRRPLKKPADILELMYLIRNNVAHGTWRPSWQTIDAAQHNAVFMASDALEFWLRIFWVRNGFNKTFTP